MNSKLRAFREEQKLSILEMSKSLGVSKSTYEKVEYGQRTPSYNFVKRFKLKYPASDTDSLFLPPTTQKTCDS